MSNIQAFDFSVDLLKSILWEYNTALNLQGILEAKQSWYNVNQTAFWTNWITDVFDLQTCNDFGCAVWAIILGIPIGIVTAPIVNGQQPWGFDTTNLTNFNGFNFTSTTITTIILTTAQKRTLLQLRYRQLTCRTTIPETNQILKSVLGSFGLMYITDNYNMTATLNCVFAIPTFIYLLFSLDLIPRPECVSLTIVQI
jgi:hypothetical protein